MVYNAGMDWNKIASPAIGKAGELRVRSELIFRGFNPGAFDFDDGTDIILSNRKRIGVKTCTNPSYQKSSYSWCYKFSIRSPQVRKGDGSANYKKIYQDRNWNEHIDYWILWCVKDNFFYIIPEGEVTAKFSLVVATPLEKRRYKKHTWKDSISKYEKYKNNWEQLR